MHASNGGLVRLLRVVRDPEPVRRADFNRFVESELEGISDKDLRREWRTRYAQMPVPETAPVYRGLLVDDVDHLWAEHFRAEADDVPAWSVFGPNGAVLGTIETPEGLTIYHIGQDFLIGRMMDDLGVEQVVRYPLDRTAGGR